MSQRIAINREEQKTIGTGLRKIADRCEPGPWEREFLRALAHRLDPAGDDPMNANEAKMVDWVLNRLDQSDQANQQLQQQLQQQQQDTAASQPTVDRLTALYNANNPAPAVVTPTEPAPVV